MGREHKKTKAKTKMKNDPYNAARLSVVPPFVDPNDKTYGPNAHPLPAHRDPQHPDYCSDASAHARGVEEMARHSGRSLTDLIQSAVPERNRKKVRELL